MPFLDSTIARSERFADIHLLGHGASGRVYYAFDTLLNIPVAIKEVLPTDRDFQKLLDKFRKESQIQARLRHTNIISVYDLKEDEQTGEYYLVFEYANAGTLAEYLQQRGALPEPIAIKIGLDICAALEKIWSERIVHCDIKPANILLTQDGNEGITAKLGDFGIAQGQRWRETTMLPGAHHPGTPFYMAPEQWNASNSLDIRTDIYALGVTLFESVTSTSYKSLLAHTALPDVRQHNSELSAGFAQVIQRAVQEDRMNRYQTPQEVANALRAVARAEQPSHTRPVASAGWWPLPLLARWHRGRAERVLAPGLVILSLVVLTLGVFLAGAAAIQQKPAMALPQPDAIAPPHAPVVPSSAAALDRSIEPSAMADDFLCVPADKYPRLPYACPVIWPDNDQLPLYDSKGEIIDHLYRWSGTQYFQCAAIGGRYTHGASTTIWWARTQGDNGNWGWVPEVFFKGGTADEPAAGLPKC